MKKGRLLGFGAGLLFFLAAGMVYSYWEWTPQTRRWINPKYAVKDTPKEQFEWAESFRKAGDLEKTFREHEKLVKQYAGSEYAPESHFILGQLYEQQGDLDKAFKHYQSIMENYPQSPRISEALEREGEIAEKILSKKSLKLLEILKADDYRVAKLEQVIENDPYGEATADRQLKLALFYADIKEYEKAEEVLQKIVDTFPGTDSSRRAGYQLIRIHYAAIPATSMDTGLYRALKAEIDEFLTQYPGSPEAREVLALKNSLDETEAGKLYQLASFYERTGKKKAARIYYEKIIQKYPQTKYGQISRQKNSSLP